jgi:hypothetical protein
MSYNTETQKRRIGERSDFSASVVHLTRKTQEDSSAEILYKIISSGEIIGSKTTKGYIIGKTPAVCFQDAPLVSICQNVYFEQKRSQETKEKLKYDATGLAFPKNYAYRKGARPVIYDQISKAKEYLKEENWWRIVNFDLSSDNEMIDWTHEREWRSPGNFDFELKETTLLFSNSVSYKEFAELCKDDGTDYLLTVKGIVVMDNLLY